MWKRLLVGLDGSEWSAAAARLAFAFARRTDAEVEGVFVADVRLAAPPLPPADMLGAPLDVPAEPFRALEAEERKRGEAVVATFAEEARAAGVRAAAAVVSGTPVEALLGRLRAADAVFLGRRGRGGAAEVGATVRAVARECVRPVVVAWKDLKPAEPRKVLVAYDGSPEAMRALRVACELAEGTGHPLGYVLLSLAADARAVEAVEREALQFCAAHGIAPERATRTGAAAAHICKAAKEFGCDLTVAPSYKPSRLKEVFLGSVTYDVLKDCCLPVLVHH